MTESITAPVYVATTRNINRAAAVIAAGGVVAIPTDTMYGLAVNPLSKSALTALFAVKQRSRGQAVPPLAATIDQVMALAEMSSLSLRLAELFWPGPLTLVLPARSGMPLGSVNSSGGVGIRIPQCAIARGVAAEHGSAITASSANKHNAAPALTAYAAAKISGVELVLASDSPSITTPSIVLDMTQKQPRILREGVIARHLLEENLGQSILL